MIKITRLGDAIILAVTAFDGQVDKKGNPAIFHSLYLMQQFSNESEQVVAVLHDVIEDTCLTMDDILEKIDLTCQEQKALIALTHKNSEPYIDYINRVKTSDLATKIKLVDIDHNRSWDRLDGLPTETIIRLITKYTKVLEILKGA